MNNITQTGLTTVSQINRAVMQGTVINDIVREQLLVVDKKILNSNKSIGENTIYYDLPVAFPNITTDRNDARILVYYNVLQSLEKRGFNVNIKLSESQARLTIKWTIGVTPESMGEMEHYLELKSS